MMVLFRSVSLALILFVCSSAALRAQGHQGDMALGASVGLPSGIAASVMSNTGTGSGSTIGLVNLTVSGGSMFSYGLSSNLELQAGLGIGLISYSTSSSTQTAPPSRNLISIMVGVRDYLKNSSDVSPYVGGQLGYSMMPEVNNVSGSMFMLDAFFGVQAHISKNVAMFTQIGLGYVSGSVTLKTGQTTNSASENTISLGGSAIGLNVYW